MSQRTKRLDELLKRELGQIFLKGIDFPKDVLVTLTRVETSNNLDEAKIYVSVFPESESKKILEILRKKNYFFQQRLNKRLKTRPVPQIRFVEEKETAKAYRIEELLEQLKREEK